MAALSHRRGPGFLPLITVTGSDIMVPVVRRATGRSSRTRLPRGIVSPPMVSGARGTAVGIASGGPAARTHPRESSEGLPKATGRVICRHYSRLTVGHGRFLGGRFLGEKLCRAGSRSTE